MNQYYEGFLDDYCVMSEYQWLRYFASELRYAISKNQVTLLELSKITGISVKTLKRYLRGEHMPSLKNIMILAAVLECKNVMDLIGPEVEIII